MRLLAIGFCHAFPDSGFGCAHGAEGREVEMVRAMARRGWEVDWVATTSGPRKDAPGVVRKPWDALMPVGAYDAVMVVDFSGLRSLNSRPYIFDCVRRHPRVLMLVDGEIGEDAHGMPVFAASCTEAAEDFRRRYPAALAITVPWAFAPVPDGLPSPWPDDRPRAVFLGIVDDQTLSRLNSLAERGVRDGFEVWIGGLFRPTPDAMFGGLTDDERAKMCSPELRFLSDLLGRPMKHGPVMYAAYWPALSHARVGLNFVPAPRRAVNCKIHEYIGAGLPVVTEWGTPNGVDVLTLDAGHVVPRDDPEAYYRALVELVHQLPERHRLKRAAQALASWDSAAGIVDRFLRPA